MTGSPQPEVAIAAPLDVSVAKPLFKQRDTAGAAEAMRPAPPAPPAEPGPLAHIPLFSMLDSNEQRILFESMRIEKVPAHQAIFWRGDRGDSMYLISAGQVSVSVPSDDGEHVV